MIYSEDSIVQEFRSCVQYRLYILRKYNARAKPRPSGVLLIYISLFFTLNYNKKRKKQYLFLLFWHIKFKCDLLLTAVLDSSQQNFLLLQVSDALR